MIKLYLFDSYRVVFLNFLKKLKNNENCVNVSQSLINLQCTIKQD